MLEVALLSTLINFPKIVCNQKEHNIGFPTFKLPTSTKIFFMTNPLNIVFDDFGR